MSIVTKTGDKGETGLFGGKRVSKDDPRIHAYGTVDELNAVIGLVLVEDDDIPAELTTQLLRTQNVLFRMGADLATPKKDNKAEVPRMEQQHIDEIDHWINQLEAELPVQQTFILPGGTEEAAMLHLARTICRRAERWVVTLSKAEEIGTHCQIYLNRLSDYLFLAARAVAKAAGKADIPVNYE